MRVIGLDVGTKTIGVAVSDELGWTAQGLETIKIDAERNNFGLDRIKTIIDEYHPEKIVVGLPKNMNGSVGPRGEACLQFAELLKNTFQIEVILWDERLSTMEAERILLSGDVSRKKRKKVIDKMAAVMILQGYLDSKQ
ncbi:Holliday junction resolvase RuvX [Calidifontibacillus erzurumensis]|uniref:Putative pre-16S rRNA nuclease n=1 Tax=Calidifontibacillus erzurumensis TaxID=2741433 RepID=A0A8J8K6Y4_9BACI|nr:Holliday junction resolvase RuvX [Calidifontibacillus erzurumensis]NSL50196.1 Holliday junction resolvase RuvX [Calidifontibacillus erzurumensis]